MKLELRAQIAAPLAYGLLSLFALVLMLAGSPTFKLVFAIVFGVSTWLMFALARRRLVVDEGGFTVRGLFGTREVAWREVAHYHYWSQHLLKAGALTRFLMRRPHRRVTHERLSVMPYGKPPIHVDPRYANVAGVLDALFAQLHARVKPEFVPFALTDTELVHRTKGRLPLADIERVDVVGATISVIRRGKRLAWVSESMARVKNGMFLVEKLAERGIVVSANPLLFVPAGVLEKVRAAASRQAALPQARLVARER